VPTGLAGVGYNLDLMASEVPAAAVPNGGDPLGHDELVHPVPGDTHEVGDLAGGRLRMGLAPLEAFEGQKLHIGPVEASARVLAGLRDAALCDEVVDVHLAGDAEDVGGFATGESEDGRFIPHASDGKSASAVHARASLECFGRLRPRRVCRTRRRGHVYLRLAQVEASSAPGLFVLAYTSNLDRSPRCNQAGRQVMA